jgi:hypothetical protein
MESKKTIIKSLSKKHDADFDIKFKLWNDFTVSKGRLAEDKEIIKYNDNDYEHFYIGNWQKRQMSRWFTNVTKKPMNIVEKKLFLTNPFFKEWTQKKSLNQKIKFKLWNAYTNEIKKLVTDSKIIYDKIYGNFNIGKWQTIEQIKWIYFNNSINEKHKNALLNNKYFKQWTDTVKIAEDADYLFYIDPKLSKYTHIDIYNHIDKIYKLIIQHFNNISPLFKIFII